MSPVYQTMVYFIVTMPVKLLKLKLNSMAWVRERTIPTERPPLVSDVSANFWGWRVTRGQCDGSLWQYSRFSRSEPQIFSFKWLFNCTHEAQWNLFHTHYFPEYLVAPDIEHRPLDLQPGTLTTRPQRQSTTPVTYNFIGVLFLNKQYM
jgi:hypothetical protein